MKYLALALLLCALLTLSNGHCFVRPMIGGSITHCQDHMDKTWHPVGSTWRNSKCFDCDCSGCCTAYSTPKVFPDDCVSVFDDKACEFKVHKKDNPSILCEIYAAVGK